MSTQVAPVQTGGIHVRALILACVLSFAAGFGACYFAFLRPHDSVAERSIYAAQLAATAARRAMESTVSGLGQILADNNKLETLYAESTTELKRVDGLLQNQRAINEARTANDQRVKQQLFDLANSTAASLASTHDAEGLYHVIYGICEQLYTVYHGHPRQPGQSPPGSQSP